MKLHYPIKPFLINQPWGVPNPAYQAVGFPFTHHNGIDAWPKKLKFPVYSPVGDFEVYGTYYRETGGGKEVWLISKEKHLIEDKECYLLMCFFHNEFIFVKPGDTVKTGQLLSIGDNTGFSTGAHLHWGAYRVDRNGRTLTFLDRGEPGDTTNGSYNLTLLFSGEHAVDKANLDTLIKNNWNYWLWFSGKLLDK